MKAWSLFYPDVLPELPGAPLPMVDQWLRNAAIEFCERSKAHVVDMTAVDAVADQMTYALPLDANTDIVEIVGVWFSGKRLTPKSPRFLAGQYGENWTAETGTPDYYLQQDAANVLLVPAPDTAEVGAIEIKASIKPGTDATGVDDLLFSKWRLAIAAGCKGNLMEMAGKDWANPELAAFNLAKFEDAVAKAETKANSGFVRSVPRFSGSFC